MIAFYCQGGLGNQLFQYAAARSLSLRLGEELVLDPWWFTHPLPGETVRSLELGHYGVRLRVATMAEQRKWRLLHGRWSRFPGPWHPLTLVRERAGGYDTAIESVRPGSYLFGYWQSERYFKDIRAQLLEELCPIPAPSPEDEKVLDAMRGENAVSLHIRRGDYVSNSSAAAFHGVCSLDYYQRAIDHVASKVEQPRLYVFSDDPDWTRENLRTDLPVRYIDHNSPYDAFQDLRLMNHCKHHIIANSSFSWWGAWLACHPDKVVVAPRDWFLAGRATPDLIPNDWARL